MKIIEASNGEMRELSRKIFAINAIAKWGAEIATMNYRKLTITLLNGDIFCANNRGQFYQIG